MILKLAPVVVILMFLGCAEALSQPVYLSGYARDSTTFDLLPYTNIYSSKGAPVGAANENGYFSITIQSGDTIVFTRLGYKPVKLAPTATAWDMNIMLPETVRLLDQVVVYDKYIIHGHEQIQKSLKETSVLDNPNIQNQSAGGTRDANLIQTFGAGMVINGALSKLFGVDGERRKMSNNKAEMIKTQVYYEVVRSMQVKEYVTKLLSLSEDDYFRQLEKFKVDYPNAVYLQSREEIVRLMVESFARK